MNAKTPDFRLGTPVEETIAEKPEVLKAGFVNSSDGMQTAARRGFLRGLIGAGGGAVVVSSLSACGGGGGGDSNGTSTRATQCTKTYHPEISHAAKVTGVAFSPGGVKIASASLDHTAKVWDASSGNLLIKYTGHTVDVNAIAFSPDGTKIATAGADGSVHVWNVANGALLLKYTEHTDAVYSVAFSPDGNSIASGSGDNTVRIWNSQTGGFLSSYRHPATTCTNAIYLAFSPDGTRIASVGGDDIVFVWNALTGQTLFSYTGHTPLCPQNVRSLVFSSDGRSVISASRDGNIRFWDQTHTIKVWTTGLQIFSLAVSPDEMKFAYVGNDLKGELYDSSSGVYHRFDTRVGSGVAFSPDGSKFVAGSADMTTKVWSAANAALLMNLVDTTLPAITESSSNCGTGGSGNVLCTCDTVCTCNTVCTCDSVASSSCTCNSDSGHYWYPN